MPNPETHGYVPEPPRPAETDPWKAALLVQRELVGRLPDDESRIRWISAHGAEFRRLFDDDPAFHELVMKRDLEGIEKRLEGPLH
ncbi:MAG TPA: hypothetical protein VL426_04145 [Candidatus Binatia bacterium]|jgi:hypothetical protein|nr:hypothetical protein [Candidatus Binatia bacterium]